MAHWRIESVILLLSGVLILSGCGVLRDTGARLFGGPEPRTEAAVLTPAEATAGSPPPVRAPARQLPQGLFGLGGQREVTGIEVNAYLWAAALDVLHFLPVQSADPYTGTITTGYGTAPGGRTAYRATVLVQSAALDATSLNLSLMTRAGPAPAATAAALEDAIMMRARQLRIAAADGR